MSVTDEDDTRDATAECDCCGEQRPVSRAWTSCGMEAFACDECRGAKQPLPLNPTKFSSHEIEDLKKEQAQEADMSLYVRMPATPMIDDLIVLAGGDLGLVIEATRACLRGDDPPLLEDVVAYIVARNGEPAPAEKQT